MPGALVLNPHASRFAIPGCELGAFAKRQGSGEAQANPNNGDPAIRQFDGMLAGRSRRVHLLTDLTALTAGARFR